MNVFVKNKILVSFGEIFVLQKFIDGEQMTRAEKTEEDKKMIDGWLAKGNEVTICPPEAKTPEEDVVYIYKVGKRGKK